MNLENGPITLQYLYVYLNVNLCRYDTHFLTDWTLTFAYVDKIDMLQYNAIEPEFPTSTFNFEMYVFIQSLFKQIVFGILSLNVQTITSPTQQNSR